MWRASIRFDASLDTGAAGGSRTSRCGIGWPRVPRRPGWRPRCGGSRWPCPISRWPRPTRGHLPARAMPAPRMHPAVSGPCIPRIAATPRTPRFVAPRPRTPTVPPPSTPRAGWVTSTTSTSPMAPIHSTRPSPRRAPLTTGTPLRTATTPRRPRPASPTARATRAPIRFRPPLAIRPTPGRAMPPPPRSARRPCPTRSRPPAMSRY